MLTIALSAILGLFIGITLFPTIIQIKVENFNLMSASNKEGSTWVNGNATGCEKPVTIDDLEKNDEECSGN